MFFGWLFFWFFYLDPMTWTLGAPLLLVVGALPGLALGLADF